MKITVLEILEAGKTTYGQFPDYYWGLELTSSEFKVLHYIYDNCLRLFVKGIKCVMGKDGSPKFWCSQSRMAENCSISHVTFKKAVASLQEKKLITRGTGEWPPGVYYIGLSDIFVDVPDEDSITEKNFRHDSKYILNLLYKEITFNTKNIETNNHPLFTNVNKVAEPQEICRTPIIVGRKPIITTPEMIRNQTYQHKLELLSNVPSSEEKTIFDLANYYEFKCRKALHSTGFKSLGKDPKASKNWKHYERILQLCKDNQWNPKLYIDSQFDRCKYWIRKQAYPYLSQMYSENAKKYFPKYLQDIQDSSSISGGIKATVEKVKSTKQIIIDSVITDCENVQEYITSASKKRSNRNLTTEQLKLLYIADHWMSLSAYYLAVIPWFIAHLLSFPAEPIIEKLHEEIVSIQKSSKLLKTAKSIVDKVESNMGIPPTLCE